MEFIQEQTRKQLSPAHELSLLAIYRLGGLYEFLGQPIKLEMLFKKVEVVDMGSAPKKLKNPQEFFENLVDMNERFFSNPFNTLKDDIPGTAKEVFKYFRHLAFTEERLLWHGILRK